MIRRGAAPLHALLALAVAQGGRHVPADTGQDDVPLTMNSLEVYPALSPFLRPDDGEQSYSKKPKAQRPGAEDA